MATIIHIPDDSADDARLNELLDAAMSDTSAPPTGSPSGGGRDNPLLDDAFADVFEDAAKRLEAASEAMEKAAEGLGTGSAPTLPPAPPAPGESPTPPVADPIDWRAKGRPAPPDPFSPADVTARKPAPDNLQTGLDGVRDGKDWRDQWENDRLKTSLQAHQQQEAQRLAEEKRKADERREAEATGKQAGLIAGGRQVAGARTATGLMTGLQAMGAGGGPVGMAVAGAVDAGTGVIKTAFERMRAQIDESGRAVTAVFRNDGFALLQTAGESAAKGLEAIPVAGGLAAGAMRGLVAPVGLVKTALEAVNGRAHELAGYSGEIATAVATAKNNRMLADIAEANQMGGRYAKMVVQQEQLERKIQEFLLPFKEAVIDTLTDLMDLIRAILPAVRATGEAAEGSRSLLRDILDALPQDWKDLLNAARRNRAQDEERARGSGLDDLGELLRGIPQIPAPGLNPVFQQAMANNQIPVLLQPGRR